MRLIIVMNNAGKWNVLNMAEIGKWGVGIKGGYPGAGWLSTDKKYSARTYKKLSCGRHVIVAN